jgi:hypothetical protein
MGLRFCRCLIRSIVLVVFSSGPNALAVRQEPSEVEAGCFNPVTGELSEAGPHRRDRIMDGNSAARHQNRLGSRSQTVSLSRTMPRMPEQHSDFLVHLELRPKPSQAGRGRGLISIPSGPSAVQSYFLDITYKEEGR